MYFLASAYVLLLVISKVIHHDVSCRDEASRNHIPMLHPFIGVIYWCHDIICSAILYNQST